MAKKDIGMTMLSVPMKEKKRFKTLAKREGRTMRVLFKLMIDNYEKKEK